MWLFHIPRGLVHQVFIWGNGNHKMQYLSLILVGYRFLIDSAAAVVLPLNSGASMSHASVLKSPAKTYRQPIRPSSFAQSSIGFGLSHGCNAFNEDCDTLSNHHNYYGLNLPHFEYPMPQKLLNQRLEPFMDQRIDKKRGEPQSAPEISASRHKMGLMPVTRHILSTYVNDPPPANWINSQLKLPDYLLDQMLDYFRMSHYAKRQFWSPYHEKSRYRPVDWVSSAETDFQGLIAVGNYADIGGWSDNSNGELLDLAIVFPGTKGLKNLKLDFQLRLVPSDLFSDSPYSSYSAMSSGEYMTKDFEGVLESEDDLAWWSVYLPTYFERENQEKCERVPAGFRTAFESIRYPLAQKLVDFIKSDPRGVNRFRTITFFGFSLGGTVATYASVFLTKLLEQEGLLPNVRQSSHDSSVNSPAIRVVTVGAPKSGDVCFQQQFASYFGWESQEMIEKSQHMALHLMHTDDPVARGCIFDMEILGRKRYRHTPGYFITLKSNNRIFDWFHHRQDLYEHGFFEWAQNALQPGSSNLIPLLDMCTNGSDGLICDSSDEDI